MDTLSHALWGGVGFGRKSRKIFVWALFFGALPDLLSFGLYYGATTFGFSLQLNWSTGPPDIADIPLYIHVLYNISHSLLFFFSIAILLWVFSRRLFVPFMAYGFAIALDIPTHELEFFPTPFLWPLSDYRFDGINWGEPLIFITNITLLAAAYLTWYYFSRKKNHQKKKFHNDLRS